MRGLTAPEVARLDWKGTELVVISACESGKGDIQAGEGVYGLMRAIAVAGARSSLLSLWKVDDRATAAFMESFYSKLKSLGRTEFGISGAGPEPGGAVPELSLLTPLQPMSKTITSSLLIAPLVLATAGAAVLGMANGAQAQYCSGGICSSVHMGQRFYWKQ